MRPVDRQRVQQRAEDLADLGDRHALVLRAVVLATRSAEQLPSLPEAQVEILRKLATAGPLSPKQLAAELDLARPTVSNLVRDLTAGSGWNDRRRPRTGARSC